MNKDAKQVQLQVALSDDVAQGTYINLAIVNHSETEFTIDLMYMQPQEQKATVRTRMISSPKHTKRLIAALQENIQRYEERFGAIDVSWPNQAPDLFQ
jgi:hypothetical protein